MQDELENIKEFAQGCLDNLNERHYYRSPYEANTIDNLKNIVIIVNEYENSKEEREKKHIEAMRYWRGPHYKRSRDEWAEQSKGKKGES